MEYATLQNMVYHKRSKKFYKNSFIENGKYMLIFMKIIGLFPVGGICSADLYLCTFSFCSLNVLITILLIMLHTAFFIIYCMVFMYSNYDMQYAGIIEYYAVAAIAYILFLKLAYNWKTVMSNWIEMDHIFQKYCEDVKLPKTTKIKSLITFALVLGEYGFLIYFDVLKAKYYNGDEFSLSVYFMAFNPEMYIHITKKPYIGVLGQIASFSATFAILMSNLFVSTMAVLFSLYIKNFSGELKKAFVDDDINCFSIEINPKLQEKNEDVWKSIRRDYNKICHLCEIVDDRISSVIYLCVVHETLAIIRYLLYVFKRFDTPFGSNYCYYSLLCIVAKLSLTLFSTSNVHEQTTKLNHVFYTISSKHYNKEMKRLLWKVTLDKLAFTLGGFFKINRETILNVFGTIVTYELFALQLKNAIPDDTNFAEPDDSDSTNFNETFSK